MLISQINKILKSTKNHVWNTKTNIIDLCIDSRKLNNPENTLFFAIKGKNHDSHQFLDDLYEKGVRNFVVEVSQTGFSTLLIREKRQQCNVFYVKNSVDALQKAVIFHRKQFDKISVIGVTGSNGKTIVKEWLSQCFSDYVIVKSPKSYNSQIGVPLSVAEINKKHQIGIFEAGISQMGEMEKLQKIILPRIGILTNIGSAHDEGFENKAQKLKEKLNLFVESAVIFIPKYLLNEFKDVFTEFQDKYKDTLIIWWDYDWDSDLVDLEKKEMFCFDLKPKDYNENYSEKWLISINKATFPFDENDKTSIENALVCVFVMRYFKFSIKKITEKIKNLKPISMRLEIKQGLFNSYLIDDSYNNDVVGLSMALNLLQNQQQKTEKALILSDILETGLDDQKQLYKLVADIIAQKNISQFVGIGENISKNKAVFETVFSKIPNLKNIAFFEDTASFLNNFPLKNFQNQVILIKGARKFAFEKIVQKMQQKAHGTILEINLDALVHNLNFFRSQIKPKTKVMVMVKAFAYGSGSAEVANLLQFHRVDYLAVAYTDEGVELRKNGIRLPIMVMNPSMESFDLLLEYDLEPEIYSFQLLNNFIDFVENHNNSKNITSKNITSENTKPIKIHLKLDTGMKRLGFEENEEENLSNILLQNQKNIIIASIMSHLAGADEAEHNEFSKNQIAIFDRFSAKIIEKIGYNPIKHIANSPAIVRFPEAQFDMIRLGIGLYGVEMAGIAQKQLMPISKLKTVISQIKHINKNETVGYSRKGIMHQNGKIATIAIGYADGFNRRFSNGVGEVSINGTLCKVIGNVCMDMTMIDVSHLKDVQQGDEVVIFDENLTISMLAKKINTIPYEVLTGISERVKRVFFTE